MDSNTLQDFRIFFVDVGLILALLIVWRSFRAGLAALDQLAKQRSRDLQLLLDKINKNQVLINNLMSSRSDALSENAFNVSQLAFTVESLKRQLVELEDSILVQEVVPSLREIQAVLTQLVNKP